MENLQLLHQGNGYVLKKTSGDGTIKELELTTDDVLSIAHSASQWDKLILERLPDGSNPVVATPVDNFGLGHDPYGTEILLEVHRKGKVVEVLSIPIKTALYLAKRLPSYLQEVAAYRKTLRNQ